MIRTGKRVIVKHVMCADLLDSNVDYDQPSDIYAIGFEEIVDLNASNIMSAR